jgi:hypothetical protein
MKKMIMLTSVFAIASLSLFAQDRKTKKMDISMHKVYTCPMHPDVASDKPGKCPKCGMTLVEKKGGSRSSDSSTHKMLMHRKDSMMMKRKMTS